MSTKFRGKYRNESARLPSWDYGSDASYFITICTKDRNHYFGEIQNGKMKFSPAGALAYAFWHEIKNHANNIELGEFIVMPNHIHGILILDGNDIVRTGHALSQPDRPRHALSHLAQPDINTPYRRPITGSNRFQNPGKNTISSIIGSYKSAITKYCNRLELPMAWQPRFHDRIIRDDRAFRNISRYIVNNPKNWKEG